MRGWWLATVTSEHGLDRAENGLQRAAPVQRQFAGLAVPRYDDTVILDEDVFLERRLNDLAQDTRCQVLEPPGKHHGFLEHRVMAFFMKADLGGRLYGSARQYRGEVCGPGRRTCNH